MTEEQKADWKGFDWNGAENCELRKYVSSLETQLAQATRERDEARALAGAMREALKKACEDGECGITLQECQDESRPIFRALQAPASTPANARRRQEAERDQIIAEHVVLLSAVAHDGRMPALVKQRNVYRLGQKLLRDLGIPADVVNEAATKVTLTALEEVRAE